MRIGLIVNPVGPDCEENPSRILMRCAEAASQEATLLLLPEAAVTGLINNDDPDHDLPLGEPISEVGTGGAVVDRLASFCRAHACWLGIGLLERDGGALYDTAVLLDPSGAVRLKYRRMHPGWHDPSADPQVYREGTDLAVADTPFGKVAFLICGDLFDDEIVARASASGLDLLLFPFARGFDDGSCDQARWDADEMPAYASQVARVGAPALMVNYLALPSLPDDGSFGGAHYVSAEGDVLTSLPLGRLGTLMVDVHPPLAQLL